MPVLPARARYGPGIAAGILITSMLLPPVAAYARQYAYAQALGFLIFAVAGRRCWCWAHPGTAARRPGGQAAADALVDRVAVLRSGWLPSSPW